MAEPAKYKVRRVCQTAVHENVGWMHSADKVRVGNVQQINSSRVVLTSEGSTHHLSKDTLVVVLPSQERLNQPRVLLETAVRTSLVGARQKIDDLLSGRVAHSVEVCPLFRFLFELGRIFTFPTFFLNH